MKRLGIVALESSHVDQYCRIFNQPDFEHRLPDARITAICPQDENTQERVDELAGTYGIETVVATPEEMIGVVDSAMMLGRDGAQPSTLLPPSTGSTLTRCSTRKSSAP